MRIHSVLAALLLVPTAFSTASAAEGFQISPRVGKTTLRLDAAALTTNKVSEQSLGLIGANMTYVTPFKFMVEGGYASQGNSSWFNNDDTYKLSEYSAAVGLQIDTPRGFRITPKVGRTRWDLFSEAGHLTNTNLDSNTRRGYDSFWELGLQKTIGNSVALGVIFKDNPYQFGNVKSIAFTASFSL